jgi:hypothetical protein
MQPRGRYSAHLNKSLTWRQKLNLTWRKLNVELKTLDETKVLEMLNYEINSAKRVSVLERLHQRYTALRASRERIEILKGANKP